MADAPPPFPVAPASVENPFHGLCDLCVPDPQLLPVDLSKHKRYEIRMSVYNAVGEGPLSPPQEVFVGEAGE